MWAKPGQAPRTSFAEEGAVVKRAHCFRVTHSELMQFAAHTYQADPHNVKRPGQGSGQAGKQQEIHKPMMLFRFQMPLHEPHSSPVSMQSAFQ